MINSNISKFENIFLELKDHVLKNKLKGYDPYDFLNSKYFSKSKNKLFRLAMTQIFRKSHINLRGLLKVRPGFNPKALALILSSISIIKSEKDSRLSKKIIILLHKLSCQGFSGYCWGYNFPWQNRTMLLPAHSPTIVNTSYTINSLLDAYSWTGDNFALKMAIDSSNFILKDLVQTKFKDEICFSYSSKVKNLVHNANVLGASSLAYVYFFNKDKMLLDISNAAISFTVSNQNSDGSWDYSMDYDSSQPYTQLDWHQGFIIESIMRFLNYSGIKNRDYEVSIINGLNFYEKQFKLDGSSYWRYPNEYIPNNIHNQAQGIITFAKASIFDKKYLSKSKIILDWTIRNLLSDSSFFYYQRGKIFTNKIDYVRWSQAWMLYALSVYIYYSKLDGEINETNNKE